jgi:hypothetical protein
MGRIKRVIPTMKLTAKPGTWEAIKEAAKIAKASGVKITWVKHEIFKKKKAKIYKCKNHFNTKPIFTKAEIKRYKNAKESTAKLHPDEINLRCKPE